jgi:uncharacterized membrane protein
MTRDDFLTRLRGGLTGLSDAAKAEIVADYETHFTEGAAAGRSEADIAAALGDPERLARELRAEIGLKRWEAERNPEAAAAAVFAVLGLGAIDILVLLPILVGVVSTMCAIAIVAIVCFVAGGIVMVVSPFSGAWDTAAAGVLGGLGMMAGAVFIAAIDTLVTIGLVNALVWYGRLHFRLLKPAIDPRPTPASAELALP